MNFLNNWLSGLRRLFGHLAANSRRGRRNAFVRQVATLGRRLR